MGDVNRLKLLLVIRHDIFMSIAIAVICPPLDSSVLENARRHRVRVHETGTERDM